MVSSATDEHRDRAVKVVSRDTRRKFEPQIARLGLYYDAKLPIIAPIVSRDVHKVMKLLDNKIVVLR